jgi:hypothetical protein
VASAKGHTARVERNMDDFKHIKVNVGFHKADQAVYRIYVDNDLITERTFAWPSYKTFIRENLICVLEPGNHTLKVENCSQAGYFELSDFSLNDDKNCVLTIQPIDDDYTGRILTFQVNP